MFNFKTSIQVQRVNKKVVYEGLLTQNPGIWRLLIDPRSERARMLASRCRLAASRLAPGNGDLVNSHAEVKDDPDTRDPTGLVPHIMISGYFLRFVSINANEKGFVL